MNKTNSLYNDFRLFSKSKFGISGQELDDYKKYVDRGGYIEPYILEEREMNVTQMSVFSRLFKDRILFLGKDIDDATSNIINSQLLFLDSIGDGDITLYINSPGGSVTDGLAIYDTMNFINSDVSTTCMGLCASMGAVLLSSGARGKRFSLPHGDIMIHQPMGQSGGQESNMAIAYEQIKKCKKTLYEILSENTGKSYEEIELAADRDHWMDSKEAIDFGIIDDVIRKK